MMNTIIPKLDIDLCRASGERWGFVVGVVKDQHVYQIQHALPASVAPLPPDVVGVWARRDAIDEAAQAPGPVLVVINDDSCEFWQRGPDGRPAGRADGMVVDLAQDQFRRIRSLVDLKQLQQTVLVIVGCGSLGSNIANLAVVSGVGHIILIDRDPLETHNVIRHLCGFSDLGRFKVYSVADRLRDKNPDIMVEAWPVDADQHRDVLEDAIRRSHLVVAATDSPSAQLMINASALAAGKPTIYPGAYNTAFGGEVIRVIPGKTACLRCVYDATADLFNRQEPGTDGRTQSYDADRGHPGMWTDLGFISLLAARMVIETRLDEHDPARHLTGDYLLWGNRRMWAFSRPLQHRWLKIRRNPLCPVCGGEAALDAHLASVGLDRASARAEGLRVLGTAGENADKDLVDAIS